MHRISRGNGTGIMEGSAPSPVSSGTRIRRTSPSLRTVLPKAGCPFSRIACSARFIVVNICLEKPFFRRNPRTFSPDSPVEIV